MVFSLFGKKSPPPKPAAKKPAARPATRPPSRDASERGGQSGEPVSRSAEPDKPSLDFTGLSTLSETSSFGSAHFLIDDTGGAMHQVIEESAMLYANDQAAAACAALEAVVRGNELGSSAERGWGMLFDLYQILGRRDDYEALALDYAGRFEKSPPAWTEATDAASHGGSHGAGRSFVALTGKLSAQAVEPMKQLLRMAETNPLVRLDASRVQAVDNGGCALLLKALQLLKKQRKECEINGSAQLIGLIKKSVVAGQREREETWLLLLDLLQREADQAAFEDLAVDYAVTFEVSPPSWEQPPVRPAQPAARQASGEAAASGFALQGELVAAGAEAFADLITFANDKSEVPIDASRLLRIDFVSAGQLLNAVSRLQMAGKHVLIYGVSHLVMSLFEIIGIGQMAEIRLRRA